MGSVRRDVNLQVHVCHLSVGGLERARCVSVTNRVEELCLSTREDSLLDQFVMPCDWSVSFLAVEQSFLYDIFCRQYLLVLIHTCPKVLITKPALRPVRVVAQKLKKTLVSVPENCTDFHRL